MLPVITIIGRPNVGKSTLFNRLTHRRDALVANQPGITRDRHYAYAEHQGCGFMLVDTGGVGGVAETDAAIAELVTQQTWQAANEADAIIWLLDGRAGMTAADERLAGRLRIMPVPVHVVVNKTEGMEANLAVAEFYASGGFSEPQPISAERGDGVDKLISHILEQLPDHEQQITRQHDGIRLAVLGRPNVGKSTLVNRMLGENRMLACDAPGTTRDAIATAFQRHGREYVLIDTAGIRRRSKIAGGIEKFSVIKSLQAIGPAEIIILVLDAQDAVTEQDQHLSGIIKDSGKSLIIAINKWDGLEREQKRKIRQQFARKLRFLEYACTHHVSARNGTGVGGLFRRIDEIINAKNRAVNASHITGLLYECLQANPPPLHRGRPIKLRYAHIGGHDPLRIIIHGNQTEQVPSNYQRYLASRLREKLRLTGTPVLIEFKHSTNPYQGKRNTLTPRQIKRRQRITRHHKK